MKIFKVSKPAEKQLVNKFWVHNDIESPCKETLLGARGVVNNYLKDKSFTVYVNQHKACKDSLVLTAYDKNERAVGVEIVSKLGENPLLRKIYIAIDNFAKLNALK